MRLLIFAFITLCCSLGVNGQNRLLSQTVSISEHNISIESILRKITDEYNVKFSYGKDNLSLETLTSIDAKNSQLGQVLEDLLTPHHIAFTVIGDQIALRKKEASAAPLRKKARQISGIVTDSLTKQPLGFASVSIKGATSGTITNTQGEFVLLVNASENDTLRISHLGYITDEIRLNNIRPDPLLIKLNQASTQLASVDIVSISPENIIQEAIHRIPKNYRQLPYRQRFYLRDRTWADGSPIQASESVYESYRGKITDEGIHKQVKLLGARRSKNNEKYKEILAALRSLNGFDIGVTAYFIFEGDLAKYKSHETFMGKGNWTRYEFFREDNTFYDGREVYVISFDQKNVNKSLMRGKFYIDTETYAFVHISQSLSPKGLDHAEIFGPKVLEKIFGLGENVMVDWSQEKHYKNLNGKWYLDYMTLKPQLSLIKKKRKFNTSIHSESNLVVTEIDTVNILPFADDDVTASRKLAYRQYGEYDYEFWSHQNIIKPDTSFEDSFLKIEMQNKAALHKKNAVDFTALENSFQTENASADWTTTDLTLRKEFTHFTIHYNKSDSIIIDSVNHILSQNYSRILNRYEVKKLPKIDIYIYPSVSAYHAAINYPNAPAWMVGSATIDKFSIVSPLNPGPAHSYASVMKGIVHEFMHCVHIHIVKNNMSKVKDNDARWLWEGLACYESDQFVEPKSLDYLTHEIPSLDQLNDAEASEMIYELGYVLIDFIKTTWGQRAILRLIKSNGDIPQVLKISESKFNDAWKVYVEKNYLIE